MRKGIRRKWELEMKKSIIYLSVVFLLHATFSDAAVKDTSYTNGFATVLPYNTIYIQTVPPSLDMTIGEYEDWLRMLIIHEYSHILTMDTARGYSEVMRGIFGKPLPPYDPISFLFFLASAPPNVFLPSWWHEGMATWGETEFTSAGRGRGTVS